MPSLPDVPDVYRITYHAAFLDDEAINVYHYRDISGVPIPAQSVAQGWWDSVKATWRALQPTSVGFINLRVECEYLSGSHPFGIYTIPVGEQQGLRAAATDWMPNWSAYMINLGVATRLTRPGNKRICGMLEGDQAQSVITAGTLTLLQAFADRLDIMFAPTGSGTNVTPVIVGYPTAAQPGSPRVQDVVSATASLYASHQVSRDRRPT